MPSDLDDLTPEQRAKVLLDRLPQRVEAPQSHKWDADLIPSITPFQRNPEESKIDAVIDQIDFAQAYVRFIGKMIPDPGNRRVEGIKISCPMPGHADTHPSAWYNSQTKLWFCGGCQTGGDIYDLGAISFGYDLNSYKKNGSFPVLRKQIAQTFGYTVVSGITGDFVVETGSPQTEEVDSQGNEAVGTDHPIGNPSETVVTGTSSVGVDAGGPSSLASTPADTPGDSVGVGGTLVETPLSAEAQVGSIPASDTPTPTESPVLAPVIDIKSGLAIENTSDIYIDWESLVTPGTFLWEWMKATTIDDLPHEFYFWQGLMALGFACGNTNYLSDFRPVKPNFYVCLYGRTGLGKSRSIYPLQEIIKEVWPYKVDAFNPPTGVFDLPIPNSAEAVIDSFSYNVKDSSTMQITMSASVKGLLRHEELSGLISRAQRQGSSVKETLIEIFDVFDGDVGTRSRSTGITTAHAPFCQIISTTQPNAVHAFLKALDIESGFLNRWIFVAGLPRVAPIAYGGNKVDLVDAIRMLKNISVWGSMGHKMDLTGFALNTWTHFFNSELAPYKSGLVNIDSIHSRTDLTLKKVIVALTANELLDQPTPEIVEKSVSLMPYLRATYSMFSGDLSFSDVTDCQNRLVEIATTTEKNKKTFPSRRDLQRAIGKKFDNETLLRALTNLVALGLFEEIAPLPGSQGRPTTRYRYID